MLTVTEIFFSRNADNTICIIPNRAGSLYTRMDDPTEDALRLNHGDSILWNSDTNRVIMRQVDSSEKGLHIYALNESMFDKILYGTADHDDHHWIWVRLNSIINAATTPVTDIPHRFYQTIDGKTTAAFMVSVVDNSVQGYYIPEDPARFIRAAKFSYTRNQCFKLEAGDATIYYQFVSPFRSSAGSRMSLNCDAILNDPVVGPLYKAFVDHVGGFDNIKRYAETSFQLPEAHWLVRD